jgi:hypothetical protein
MPELGSDIWLNAEEVDDPELSARAKSFVDAINWEALESAAATKRNVRCTLSEKFSLGHFNLVRRIIFDDGVNWIARLRLPELPDFFGTRREALGTRECMEIEISTAKYLR